MSHIIGYMEGTDPLWLTSLQLQGHDTVPMSNGMDGHGLNVQQLSQQHGVSLVLCYMHKLVPPRGIELTAKELLHATWVYGIPVLIACPAADHQAALKRLGELPDNAKLVDPAEMLRAAAAHLG